MTPSDAQRIAISDGNRIERLIADTRRLVNAAKEFVRCYEDPAVNMLGEPLQSQLGKERRLLHVLRAEANCVETMLVAATAPMRAEKEDGHE